jgi:CBS domain-containing protein
MMRTNLHHLPVLKKGQVVGVIALSDVAQHESKSTLFIVSGIFKQNSIEELTELAESVRASFVRMVNEDANSRMIGSAMATIGRSFKQRLLELGEEKFGPPPVPYCFLALGSMARDEQSIVTDQDNAMVLHDDFDPKQHDAYFKELAGFVADGLNACGYTYCTGGIMATTDAWRQPLKVWKNYFTDWIENPSPEKLLHSSIFFDLDGVWGQQKFADELNSLIRKKAKGNKRFLGSMARNALNRTPPLGFFKDFVMEKDGKHRDSINTKRRGTGPVADLIRVHALAIASSQRNSFTRLEDIIDSQILPQGRGPDLRDALELISMVRIRHQALAISAGEVPDNNVAPEDLSHFERKNLKDAFQILSNAQKYLRYRYSGG